MKHQSITQRWGTVIAALLLATALGAPVAIAQEAVEFSGRATAFRATVLGLNTVLSDTGPLPAQGGALEDSLLTAEVPGILRAELLHVSTIGQGDRSRSEASLASLDLTVAGNTIGAEFLMASATAICTNAGPATEGNSEIVALVINGQTIGVGTEPNQTVNLPGGGQVIINEQSSSMQGNRAEMTVRALHIIIPGVAEVVVSEAYADVVCKGQPVCPNDKDFVTSGGWIVNGNARANFAVAGGIKNGSYWGHLHYIDHGTGTKVKGTAVTGYIKTGATSRKILGNCEINGAPGTYEVEVADNGEPGRADTFSIRLSSGYAAAGTLGGGNIQLHECR